MAGLRAFSCYRNIERAYTRKSKYKRKSYIRTVPTSKIVKFIFGDKIKDFPYRVDLKSKQPLQVRHNAIESARLMIVRRLNPRLGKNYRLQIRQYPHHVLRENKMITGAGADRMQTGMQKAFGRPVGLAARVKAGTIIFSVYVDKNGVDHAIKAVKDAFVKLPCTCAVAVQELKK
ncbi:MAG: 50S ribosomal protein L16 [archaeon]